MATNGAHANGTRLFTPEKYPPFPKDVPSVKLETFSLAQLEKGDKALEEKLLRTCKERGFFYLDLNGSSRDSMGNDCEDIARLAEKVFQLPDEVKAQYPMTTNIFGYVKFHQSISISTQTHTHTHTKLTITQIQERRRLKDRRKRHPRHSLVP
jgi:isopenicillin N synthase-like dioxygenase